MAGTDQSVLNGFFKDIWGQYVTLKEETSLIQRLFNFSTTDNLGGYFQEAVEVQSSHGTTIVGQVANATLLKNPVSLETEPAKIRGSIVYFSEWLDWATSMRAQTTKQAFAESTKLLVSACKKNAERTVELLSLYGQNGLTTITSRTVLSGTQLELLCKLSEWATGMWEGMEGLRVQFYNGNTLVSSGADADFNIYQIDSDRDNRLIFVEGTSTGITALSTAINSNPNVIKLYMNNEGSRLNEPVGIHTISGNLTDVLFNINPTTWNQWKANVLNVGGSLTFAKVQDGVARVASRGFKGDMCLFVNWVSWTKLANDAASMRMTDSSYSRTELDVGSEAIKFYCGTGIVEIYQHQYVKEGYAYLVPKDGIKRIGSTDVTFKWPMGNEIYFWPRPEYSQFELRAMTDQAPFTAHPKRFLRFEGIVN
ncbi:hypothetical protein [Leptospira johnsonii]|uniref:Uncharacterized protein n=1 Tax=Leptospira johnsonii TaxID=1917820 RepID=A0A2P2D7T5_9LEPT|nr:hypothetical protein [Leptospira johnsonii]GBF40693.1 hypothetical protein LPTSP1_37110 [Leptospira johnsonii]